MRPPPNQKSVRTQRLRSGCIHIETDSERCKRACAVRQRRKILVSRCRLLTRRRNRRTLARFQVGDALAGPPFTRVLLKVASRFSSAGTSSSSFTVPLVRAEGIEGALLQAAVDYYAEVQVRQRVRGLRACQAANHKPLMFGMRLLVAQHDVSLTFSLSVFSDTRMRAGRRRQG